MQKVYNNAFNYISTRRIMSTHEGFYFCWNLHMNYVTAYQPWFLHGHMYTKLPLVDVVNRKDRTRRRIDIDHHRHRVQTKHRPKRDHSD